MRITETSTTGSPRLRLQLRHRTPSVHLKPQLLQVHMVSVQPELGAGGKPHLSRVNLTTLDSWSRPLAASRASLRVSYTHRV